MKIHKKIKIIVFNMLLCTLCFSGCGKEKEVADFSGITSVCELATLKCYYHNVASVYKGIHIKTTKNGLPTY